MCSLNDAEDTNDNLLMNLTLNRDGSAEDCLTRENEATKFWVSDAFGAF